jgi:tripartite-type tricarboxylate transporter receptor subunit TctC
MRQRLLLPALLACALVWPLQAAQAAYPDKPIRIIVPSAPGGAADVLMRALGAQLGQQMGVPFVIENKPGAASVIGIMELVRSPADGYTLAYGNIVSLATNKSLIANLPYDVDKNLTLVANTLRVVNMMVVNNDVPAKTLPQLIAYAKANPGKLAYGSEGNGTTSHLGMEYFKSLTGTYILHVPYKGAAAALNDVMGGGVQLMMGNTPVMAPQVQGGRVRALGISSKQRSAAHPDVPPIADTVPGFEVAAWGGIVGPANLPPEVVRRLTQEIRTALDNPALRERFRVLGAETMFLPADAFRELARSETEKWAKVVKFSGAKMD